MGTLTRRVPTLAFQRRRGGLWTPSRFLGMILLAGFSLLLNAWWHIQAVRLGYQATHLSSMLADAKNQNESLHEDLSHLSSLPRLEERARTQGRGLPVPRQIVLMYE